MSVIDLPKKTDINIPNKTLLEELYFKLYHLKVMVDRSELEVEKYNKELKTLNNSSVMKRYRLLEFRVKRFGIEIRQNQRKFKKLFDEYVEG